MRVQDELLKQEVNADLRQTRLSTVFDALGTMTKTGSAD